VLKFLQSHYLVSGFGLNWSALELTKQLHERISEEEEELKGEKQKVVQRKLENAQELYV
jgi:hypothetical protein